MDSNKSKEFARPQNSVNPFAPKGAAGSRQSPSIPNRSAPPGKPEATNPAAIYRSALDNEKLSNNTSPTRPPRPRGAAKY